MWWSLPIKERIAESIKENKDPDLKDFLLPGLQKIHSFSSTLIWWHGNWVGQVPFWRPLTSYLFWFEYSLFPKNRYDLWFDMSAISHLVFCAVLGIFVAKLTGRRSVSLLTLLVFSGLNDLSPTGSFNYSLDLFGTEAHPPSTIAFIDWKDQPEIWSSIFLIGSLTFILYKKWTLSLVGAAIAIGFKENGWLTFPLAAILLWGTDSFSRVPKSFYLSAIGVAVALLLVRLSSGREVFHGYHFGENNAWAHRYILAAFRPYPASFYGRYIAEPILGTGAYLAWRFYKLKPLYGWLTVAVALAAAIGNEMSHSSVDALTALTMFFLVPDNIVTVATAFLWLLGVDILWNGGTSRRLILSLVAAVLLSSALIAMAAQVQPHVLYLAFAFRSILFALTLMTIWNKLKTFTMERIKLPPVSKPVAS